LTLKGWTNPSSVDKVEVYDGYRGTGRLLAQVHTDAPEFIVHIAPEQVPAGAHTLSLYTHTLADGWMWARSISIETAARRCDDTDDTLDVASWSVGSDGVASLSGHITNHCPVPMAVELSVPMTDAAGQPVAISGAVAIDRVEPGRTTAWSTSVAGLTPGGSYQARPHAAWHTSETTCVDVGLWAPCLEVDGWVVAPVRRLGQTSLGQSLLAETATAGVSIQRGPTPSGSYAVFRAATRSIVVNPSLDTASDWERAAVIGHELQHASDFSRHKLITVGNGCYAAELAAFTTQSMIWSQLWQGRLPAPQSPLQAELNEFAGSVASDPAGFFGTLQPVYQAQCTGQLAGQFF
jgi:hypothetical protein